MPQIITCPDCERKLRVPDDLLGKKVRCPGCSVMFKAILPDDEGPIEDPIEEPEEEPVSRRAAPAREERYADSPRASRRLDHDTEEDRPRKRQDDEDEDYPRPRRDRYDDDNEERGPSVGDRKAGWNKVRIGINLVMIGTWVWIAGLVLGGLGVLLGAVVLGGGIASRSAQTGLTSLGFAGILLIVSIGTFYLCAFAEQVLRLVGYGLCMAVPSKRNTGLKPLAITAFALGAAHAVLNLLNIVVSGFSSFASSLTNRSNINPAGSGLSLLAGVVALASFIVFLFFLRSVCNNARARELAGTPITVLIVFVSYWVVAFLVVMILACAGGFAVATAVQSRSASSAATSMGAWAVIAIIVACLGVLVYLGLQVWYVMVLRNIRDAVTSHRRRL